MTDTSLDQLGPVDYIVVEFPAGASNFTGDMAKELVALVDSGTIRVIDVLILTKDEDGSVEAMELSDVPDLGPLQQIETELAELLAADDVADLAAAMDPGSTAGVLIWENLWAAPFASAARRSGGQLIADGRIPIQAIIASILEADDDNTEGDACLSGQLAIEAETTPPTEETTCPQATRVGRAGVIGPVARTGRSAKAVHPGDRRRRPPSGRDRRRRKDRVTRDADDRRHERSPRGTTCPRSSGLLARQMEDAGFIGHRHQVGRRRHPCDLEVSTTRRLLHHRRQRRLGRGHDERRLTGGNFDGMAGPRPRRSARKIDATRADSCNRYSVGWARRSTRGP